MKYLTIEQNSCYFSFTSINPTGEDQGQDVPALLDVLLLLTAPQALLTHSPRYWDDLLLEGLAVEPVLHPRRLFEEQLTQKTVENWEAGYRLKNIQSTVKNIKSVDRSHLKSSYIPNRKNKLICFNIIFLIHEYYMTCYINWMMFFTLNNSDFTCQFYQYTCTLQSSSNKVSITDDSSNGIKLQITLIKWPESLSFNSCDWCNHGKQTLNTK